MKVKLIGTEKAVITPTGDGMIRDIYTGRTYSEVSTRPWHIGRYEDADPVEYEEVDVDTLPDDVKAVFDQVVTLILTTAQAYNAIEDLKALPNISISSLFGLANAKGVPPDKLQEIITQIVLLKTDIEAKYPKSWYSIWNGDLKPYILESLNRMRGTATA